MVLVDMRLLQSSNNSSLSNTARSKRYRFARIPAYKEYSGGVLCWGSRGWRPRKDVNSRSGERLAESTVPRPDAKSDSLSSENIGNF